MRSAMAAVLLVSALLAGCSDPSPSTDDPSEADFTDLDLAASETTGILRGVVVDEAIRPVAGVEIQLTGPTPGNVTTTADGLFGFDGLAPGDYFVQASKAGFQSTQQSAQVVAGVADPPIVKVLLTLDPSTAPYVSTLVFEGFIECSGSFVGFGLAVCSTAGLPNDRFIQSYALDRPPQWIQSEMSWESTQAISPELDLVFSAPGEGVLLDNYAEVWGPSPLLLTVNETLAAERRLGSEQELMIRVFNQPIEGTETGDPVEGDDCVDRPALGGCTTGVGMTIQQQFTIITNVFYGFTPAQGWLYVAEGPHPLPA